MELAENHVNIMESAQDLASIVEKIQDQVSIAELDYKNSSVLANAGPRQYLELAQDHYNN